MKRKPKRKIIINENTCESCKYFLDDFKSPTGKQEYYCAYKHDYLDGKDNKCEHYEKFW